MIKFDFIENIIYLESLHRYCFDKLYVQSYQITDDDKKILEEYKTLYNEYPNFRQECADAIIFLSNIDRELNEKESKLLDNLKIINFNRYSIDKKLKESIKSIKSD